VPKFRISYNAPVVLTFALLAVVVKLVGGDVPEKGVCDNLTCEWFTSQGHLDGARSYVTLFTHILGHANWNHLIGNFMLILLIGPILEERYKSLPLLIMIVITALVSGLVDVALGDHTLGASGIVFMMILLASMVNVRHGEIPLTFIAVALVYLGGQLMDSFQKDNVSQLGHIIGGICGAVFGFLGAKAKEADTIKPAALDPLLRSPKPSVAKKP
jgi:membrane associated rhomboid family serine protease